MILEVRTMAEAATSMASAGAESSEQPAAPDALLSRLTGIFLLGSFLFLFWFAQGKLLSFDELLSLFTENAPSAKALIHLQSTIPVSLDPVLYHLLGHWALLIPMAPAFSVRLPSLIGSLVMLGSVYVFTQRLAGRCAALLTLLALLLSSSYYMVDARPYGILLGTCGLSLLFWSNAVREIHRRLSLGGLFLTLALAVSCHYFGILVAVPIALAEAQRSLRRRRMDLSLAAAIGGSYLAAACWLPFLAAAHQYKASYYTRVRWVDLPLAYTLPLSSALKLSSDAIQWTLFAGIAAALVLFVASSRRRIHRSHPRADEWIAVGVLAFLPIVGVMLAHAASGAFESRYVVEFSIGMWIAVCGVVGPLLPSRKMQGTVVIAGMLLVSGRFVQVTKRNKQQIDDLKASWELALAGQPTVVTDHLEFAQFQYYHGQASPSAQILWVADMAREVASSGTDNIDRTMLNLAHFTGMHVVPYGELRAKYPTVTLLESTSTVPPNWIVHQLQVDRAQVTSSGLHGNDRAYRVRLDTSAQ